MKLLKKEDTINFTLGDVSIAGNTLNGALIGLDKDGDDFYSDIVSGKEFHYNRLEPKKKELCDSFIECGMFYKDGTRLKKVKQLSSAYVHVTNRCNLNCVGCYSMDENRNKQEDLSLNEIKYILKILKKNGLVQLIISGGEPFLRKDLVDILIYAKKTLKIEFICVITNGTLVTKENLEKMKGYIDVISVSMDGYSKEQPVFIRGLDIFDKIINSIKLIQEFGITANLLPTIHKQNIKYIHKYEELAKELGCAISFSVLTNNTEESNEFIPDDEDLILLASKTDGSGINIMDTPINAYTLVCRKSCGVGKTIISVTAKGDIYPCHMLHIEALKMGNILTDNLEEVLNNSIYYSLNVQDFDTCKDCKYLNLCGGGCRCRAYMKNKNFTGADSYCALFKGYFATVEKKISTMAEKI